MSQATHFYLDHAYEPDPEERGLYWATRYIDTRKSFGFMPDNLFANVDVSIFGSPVTIDEACGLKKCSQLKREENIIGKLTRYEQTASLKHCNSSHVG